MLFLLLKKRTVRLLLIGEIQHATVLLVLLPLKKLLLIHELLLLLLLKYLLLLLLLLLTHHDQHMLLLLLLLLLLLKKELRLCLRFVMRELLLNSMCQYCVNWKNQNKCRTPLCANTASHFHLKSACTFSLDRPHIKRSGSTTTSANDIAQKIKI